ncbi:hypothetical protein BDW62DRAFT_164764 [Aspergillus aurantiobrunneus]
MECSSNSQSLPPSTSPTLHLTHPTPPETLQIWHQTSTIWKDALTASQYIEEYAHLLAAPLARNNGITQWILVDKSEPVDRRSVLASCETFRKRALINSSNANGDNCMDVIAHGIASVYCAAPLRNRGYASRLLRELSKTLPTWQTEHSETRCVASVLYSDIAPGFYQRLGWSPFPSWHLEFDAEDVPHSAGFLYAEDLATLCEEDEAILRASMSMSTVDGGKAKRRFAIIPDHDHIAWHHSKEEFGAQRLFGKIPRVKGAIAGSSGNRVWVIWTHRFYRHSDTDESGTNTLYILRFVVEGADPAVGDVRAVLLAAQDEAAHWGLSKVKLWSPSEVLEGVIGAAGIAFERLTRTQDSISCLQWYGEADGLPGSMNWVLNEKYAWC